MVLQTSCKKDMEQMDLLQAFEIIVDKAKNSSLGEKFYEEADSYLGFVSDKLDISKYNPQNETFRHSRTSRLFS